MRQVVNQLIWGMGLLGVDTALAMRTQIGSNPISSTSIGQAFQQDAFRRRCKRKTILKARKSQWLVARMNYQGNWQRSLKRGTRVERVAPILGWHVRWGAIVTCNDDVGSSILPRSTIILALTLK